MSRLYPLWIALILAVVLAALTRKRRGTRYVLLTDPPFPGRWKTMWS